MKCQLQSLFALFCLSINVAFSQTIINVPSDHSTIQSALNAASTGTTILVAPGTYFENLVWPENIDGIQLRSEEGIESTIIDGQQVDRVIRMSGSWSDPLTDATMIQGFTLQNGYTFEGSGGGLHIVNGSPILRDLLIKSNSAEGNAVYGAGAYLINFEGLIDNCDFIQNKINSDSRSYGAGLYLEAAEDVEIKNCLFEKNEGETLDWAYGGGLYVTSDWNLTMIPTVSLNSCVFFENSTTTEKWSYGGAAYFDDFSELNVRIDSCVFESNTTNISNWSYGGALSMGVTDTEISNSSFRSNSSGSGTSIIFSTFSDFATGMIKSSVFSNNFSSFGNVNGGSVIQVDYNPMRLSLQNCIIDHNIGPSINYALWQGEEGTLNLDHCTIAYNSGPMIASEIALEVTNSIFWNTSETEISNDLNSSNLSVKNCVVKGGFQGDNIISTSPDFIDEYLLIPNENSRCLNGGCPLSIDNDIVGNPRPMPINSFPDIGAYEVDQYFAHIQIKFFIDENENGLKDALEHYTSLGSAVVDDETFYNNFWENGIYIIVQQGEITLKYDESWDARWNLTNQSEYNFLIDTEDFSEVIEYGLSPRLEVVDVFPIITGNPFRCGEEVDFALSLKNSGTTIAKGIAWLEVDTRLEEFTFEIEPNYTESSHIVGWDFENLLPGECLDFNFIVKSPLVQSVEDIGEYYSFDAELEIENNIGSNRFNFQAEHRCSYDPNDKAVNPYRQDNLALIDSDLLYTIRFQNTGNDYAKHVSIKDTIDANLDMSTFEIINCSHPDLLQVIISNEREVDFQFRDIYLIDSLANEPESHGHINYSIKPIEGIEVNTNITNTAYIYFDFNPAIVTNTTESIIVEEFPSLNTIDNTNAFSILASPNPMSNYVNLDKEVDRIIIYNALGQVVLDEKDISLVNVQHLEEGAYFVEYKYKGLLAKDTWVVVK